MSESSNQLIKQLDFDKFLVDTIASELSVKTSQVDATVQLMHEGATVPFIARYRKEATGGLDDSQLRQLEEKLGYLRELTERKQTVLARLVELEQLTPSLCQTVFQMTQKQELEDFYLPYKPKRRTKAQIAREAGLAPLAEQILQDPNLAPDELAQQFIDESKNIPDSKAALDGARQILMEQFAEDAQLIGQLRDYLWQHAFLAAKVQPGKEQEGKKFADYFSFHEAIKSLPSHRILALLRGRREGVLSLRLGLVLEPATGENEWAPLEAMVASHFKISMKNRPADAWLSETVHWTWRIKMLTHLELDIISKLREQADTTAIHVFGENLRDLLLTAPAGAKTTLGLDPGLRTGVKALIVDATGKVLDAFTLFPHPPKKKWAESLAVLVEKCKKYGVELISVGNGTASRETDKLCRELIKENPDLNLTPVVVSEAGASVYSASELAANEFPDLDVSLRGAASIARRLQDPLAELVKIDPKSIGVGQYQHDVNQTQLSRCLDLVVEDCVNQVGVDLNTASVPLLSRVAGLNNNIASNIVSYRDQNGAFKDREQLKQVPRLGPKSFEQAAGFLRIRAGANPLDCSCVHPEAYPVVEKILATLAQPIEQVIGNADLLKSIEASDFTDEQFGLPTIQDILKELAKPGRDPRPEFHVAQFKEGVETLADLKSDMILEGVITNVTAFGAFVDIGVHQDGLVHISELANRFVSDPREFVKAGQIVKVKVMEVDQDRKRITLSMRLEETRHTDKKPTPAKKAKHKTTKPKPKPIQAPRNSAMSSALLDALKGKDR